MHFGVDMKGIGELLVFDAFDIRIGKRLALNGCMAVPPVIVGFRFVRFENLVEGFPHGMLERVGEKGRTLFQIIFPDELVGKRLGELANGMDNLAASWSWQTCSSSS